MSTEENKALIRRFNEEVWNRGNLAVVEEVFASDWVWRSAPPGMPPIREALRQMAAGFRSAFSDIRTSVDDQTADGDKVAWRWTFRARHTGEFMGIPPTGKQVTFTGISVDRIAGGKFVERWDSADMLGLLQLSVRARYCTSSSRPKCTTGSRPKCTSDSRPRCTRR